MDKNKEKEHFAAQVLEISRTLEEECGGMYLKFEEPRSYCLNFTFQILDSKDGKVIYSNNCIDQISGFVDGLLVSKKIIEKEREKSPLMIFDFDKREPVYCLSGLSVLSPLASTGLNTTSLGADCGEKMTINNNKRGSGRFLGLNSNGGSVRKGGGRDGGRSDALAKNSYVIKGGGKDVSMGLQDNGWR